MSSIRHGDQSMRSLFLAGGLSLVALVTTTAWATDPAQSPGEGPSQEALERQKTENCTTNADAKGLQGEARDTFMGQCLKATAGGSAMKAAPTKEQTCMTQADDQKLAGPAR